MWSLLLVVLAANIGILDAIRCNDTYIEPKGKVYRMKNCKSEILRYVDTSFDGVTHIAADKNLIKSLDNETFRDGRDLSVIYLMYNEIETIQVGTFDKTKNLKHLYLRNNEIINLEPGVFRGLTNLKELWLQSNQIRILRNGLFKDQGELDQLYFNDNKIEAIGTNAFPRDIKISMYNFEGNICMNTSDNQLQIMFQIDENCVKFYDTFIENEKQQKILDDQMKAINASKKCKKTMKLIEEECDEYKNMKHDLSHCIKNENHSNNILQIVLILEICGFLIFLIICFLLTRELNNFYQTMTMT